MVTPFPWDDYPKYRISTDKPGHSTSAEVVRRLGQLHSMRPEGMTVEELGRSVEGQPISLVTIGQGSRTVLLWSQMHGDESTHTHVLLDLLSLLQRSPEHPHARAILAGCTLRIVPLLNPDGAGRQSRHNAQDIDINRDARQLQTPEGRILKGAVERVPMYESFVTGAKEGFDVAVMIIPYLVAILFVIKVFTASGLFDDMKLAGVWMLSQAGMEEYAESLDLLPLALTRPLSGGGARGILADLFDTHGPDSFLGKTGSLLMGSTETTFYVLSVYFGAVQIKKVRHTLPACLIADVSGIITAIVLGYFLFGG